MKKALLVAAFIVLLGQSFASRPLPAKQFIYALSATDYIINWEPGTVPPTTPPVGFYCYGYVVNITTVFTEAELYEVIGFIGNNRFDYWTIYIYLNQMYGSEFLLIPM